MCIKSTVIFRGHEGEDEASRSRVVTLLVGLVTLSAGAIRLVAVMPAEHLLIFGIVLLGGLGLAWAGRSLVHLKLHYFKPLPDHKPHRYRLMCVSGLNAGFNGLWLVAVLALLHDPNPFTAIAVTIAIIGLVFLLSLLTHSAAQAADYERGSEWVRLHLRAALEPGRSTWLGWLLIALIEARSKTEHLSTFVGGILALLLTAVVMMMPAALEELHQAKVSEPNARPAAIAAASFRPAPASVSSAGTGPPRALSVRSLRRRGWFPRSGRF